MAMNKEEFKEHVIEECHKTREYVYAEENKASRDEMIKYLKELNYDIHYPEEEKEFKFIFVSKKGEGDYVRPCLEMAYNAEKVNELYTDKTKNLLCNKCGGDMNKYWDDDEPGSPHGLVNAKVNGGYLSEPLMDTTVYKFSLCEHCLHEMFLGFKSPPEISLYMV